MPLARRNERIYEPKNLEGLLEDLAPSPDHGALERARLFYHFMDACLSAFCASLYLDRDDAGGGPGVLLLSDTRVMGNVHCPQNTVWPSQDRLPHPHVSGGQEALSGWHVLVEGGHPAHVFSRRHADGAVPCLDGLV